MAKVLIVDDDMFVVAVVEKILLKDGYDVISASNGEEGLSLVNSDDPDIVILDVLMPGMDGIEVLQKLKQGKETCMIPVIMLSGKEKVEDRVAGFETGADDYIAKPFQTRELLVRIKALIEKKIYIKKKVYKEKREAVESIVDGVAHEVRNPIIAIGGFARRLKEKLPLESDLKIYAEHILHEIERLELMVNQIINLKTVVVSINDAVNVEKILCEARGRFSAALAEKGIVVKEEFSDIVPTIPADSDSLCDAFTSIIKNSIEAMDKGGLLTLRITVENRELVVDITDSGHGIPKSQMPFIFRPFYTSKMTGSGMGLAYVNHIISLHSGDVNISSMPDSYTKVSVSLPLK